MDTAENSEVTGTQCRDTPATSADNRYDTPFPQKANPQKLNYS